MALRLNVTQFLLGSQRGRIEKLGLIIIVKPEFLVLETGIALAIRKALFFLFSFALLIASVSR